METNGITIPEASTSTEYIIDSIGGWVYKVITTVSVSQQNLNDFDKSLAKAREQLTTAQALVDELEAQAPVVQEARAVPPVAEEMKP